MSCDTSVANCAALNRASIFGASVRTQQLLSNEGRQRERERGAERTIEMRRIRAMRYSSLPKQREPESVTVANSSFFLVVSFQHCYEFNEIIMVAKTVFPFFCICRYLLFTKQFCCTRLDLIENLMENYFQKNYTHSWVNWGSHYNWKCVMNEKC